MRRFGLLAALGLSRPALGGPLMDLIRERRAARAAEQDGIADGDSAFGRAPVPLPAGVVVDRDLPYGADAAQRLDVYRPTGASGAAIILYVHGGGWQRGDKAMGQMVRNKAPHWTARGHVFVSTNYRMLPAANVIEQADDVARALSFVQSRARTWGGDPARVVLVGHSAGAHLVALLTADASATTRQGAHPWLATVALDSAALDMVAIMNRRHYRFYDPVFGSDPAFWRDASPMHRLHARPAAPMLLVCSTKRDDSCPPAREFADKATSLGGRATVLPIALNHMEINDQLGLRGEFTDAVDAFLKSVGV